MIARDRGREITSQTVPHGRRLDIGLWFPRPQRGARLAQELRQRGHEVTIYHSVPVPGDQRYVHHVDYSILAGLRALGRVSHDVMYTSGAFLPVLQLRVHKWRSGRPYVFVLNGAIWSYYGERRLSSLGSRAMGALYPWLLRVALRGADAVVANSRYLADDIRDRFPKTADKTSAIYNGIDFDAMEAASPRGDAWASGDTRFLSVVTLNFERKTDGVRLLLDAFDSISRRHEAATYLIAAKSERPDMLGRVRAHLAGLPCRDRVRIETNRDDVPDLLATADLFLYATPADSSDSLPRTLLEAQAAGVPTVTTDTTGCGEAVLDGETGRVVPYDADAVAHAALGLIQDRDLASQLAANGKVSVRERFSWDAMAQSYEGVFMRVVDTEAEKPVRA